VHSDTPEYAISHLRNLHTNFKAMTCLSSVNFFLTGMKVQGDEGSGRILPGDIRGAGGGGGHAAPRQVPVYLNLYLNSTPLYIHA
jgi:hypothetical protein